MALEVSTHAHVAEIPEWDAIRPPSGLYMASWWLARAEAMFAGVSRTTYVVVRRGARVVGGLPLWTFTDKGVVLPPLEPSRLFARWSVEEGDLKKTVVAPMPASELYPFTIAGTPRGYAGRLLVADDLEGPDRQAVIDTLLDRAEAVAREHGSKLLFLPYLTTADAAEVVSARGPRVTAAYGVTDCYLEPVPASVEAYVAGMSTSNRRRKLRGDMEDFTTEGLRVEPHRLGEVLDRVSGMLLDHLGAHGWSVNTQRVHDDYVALAAEHDDRTRCFCAMRGEQIVATSVYLVHEGVAYGRAYGHAPDAGKRGAIYFNLAFYGPIGLLAPEGIRAIHIGTGAIDTKYRRGCKVMARWNLVSPLVPWSRETRSLVVACGESMLDADVGILTPLTTPASLDRELGLTAIRALQERMRSLVDAS